MAEFKQQTFFFSNGKQIKLYGTGFGVTKTLEITEASAPNVFWLIEGQEGGKPTTTICNPYKLTAEEIMEVADYYIRQWMDVKDNVRRYGVDSPKVFNREISGLVMKVNRNLPRKRRVVNPVLKSKRWQIKRKYRQLLKKKRLEIPNEKQWTEV